MGAKTCKCGVGAAEQDQLKLSRDPGEQGTYDFPSDAAVAKDLQVSALVGSTSNHVSPLPPSALQSHDDRGAHADAAAGISDGQAVSTSLAGKLPVVAEETGEDLDTSSRQNAQSGMTSESRSRHGAEQLAELKEALLECIDSSGQMAAAPGKSSAELEALAARTCADAAAGQPSEAMVYSGAAADAAAAEALVDDVRKSDHRREAGLATGDGQIIDMTLPAAADLVLSADSKQRGFHHGAPEKDLLQTQMSLKAEILEVSKDAPQDENAKQLGCWSVNENSSSCVCPCGANNSLELHREDRGPSEQYELHGTGSTAPGQQAVSALAIPPEPAQAELDVDQDASRPDHCMDEIEAPPPDCTSPNPDDSDLRAAAEELAEPPSVDVGVAGAVASDESPSKHSQSVEEEEGLDGQWTHDAFVNTIKDGLITFASGEECTLETTSKTTCQMVLDGTTYYGRLTPDRQKLVWSDGDVWMRKKVLPAAPADSSPSHRAAELSPSAVHGEQSPENKAAEDAKSEAVAPSANEGHGDNSADEKQQQEGSPGTEQPHVTESPAKADAGDATPPKKKGLCGCFGGGGNKPPKKNSSSKSAHRESF